MTAKQKSKRLKLKPISLYPLTPEQALAAFMKIGKKKAGTGKPRKKGK